MKPHYKFITLATALALVTVSARAGVTLSFEAEEILQGGVDSNPAAGGSLVLLVADTTGAGFEALDSGPITVGSMIDQAGNDMVVAEFSITAGNFLTNNEPVLDATLNNDSLFGSWAAGDPLAIYWIPALTTANTAVGSDVAYGMYTDQIGLNGSAPWITPTNGSTANTMFFTTDGVISNQGNVPASDGYSSLLTASVTVPEPSTYALLAGVVGLSAAALRRRKTFAAAVV